MTNQEVNQFLIDNGLKVDIKIVNAPVFVDYYIVNDYTIQTPIQTPIQSSTVSTASVVSRTHSVDTIKIKDIPTFISYMNSSSKKWFIFNDMVSDFNLEMQYIRAKGVIPGEDELLKIRYDKINKITKRMYDKETRGNRFLYA